MPDMQNYARQLSMKIGDRKYNDGYIDNMTTSRKSQKDLSQFSNMKNRRSTVNP